MTIRSGWASVAIAVFAVSCARPQPAAGAAGPVEAVQAFSAAIARGDAGGAWALLSTRTQREADRLAEEARKKTGSELPASGRQMLFASAVPGGKITAREISGDGGTAQVEVSDSPNSKHTFLAVREGGSWKLDLDLAEMPKR